MGQNKIAEARRAKGWTQEDLAERMGTTQQTIQRYEAETRDIKASVLRELSITLGVTATYLLGMATPEDDQTGYVSIPLFGCIAASMPIEMEAADQMYPIPTDVHAHWPNAFLLRVEGESMNRILPNGSYALVNPYTSIDYDGQPYALRIDDNAATIKRVSRTVDGYVLRPDSTDSSYRPVVLNNDDPACGTLSIIGRVVWHCIPTDWSY